MAELAKQFAFRRGLRASGTLLLALGVGSACTDEVGGDGWVKPTPTDNGGSAGSSDAGGDGGDDAPMTGGKGGSSSGGKGGSSSGGKGGKGGSGGRAGSGMTDAGAGGETPSGPVCGNGTQEEGEECDDGNKKGFDGCAADCRSSCEACEQTFCSAVRGNAAGDFGYTQPEPKKPYDLFETCKTLVGAPTTGTAIGVPRSELCQEMVDCIRREQCAQFIPDNYANFGPQRDYVFYRCFLDIDITTPKYTNIFSEASSYEDDPKTGENNRGACYQEILDASEQEKNAPSKIPGGFYTLGKAMGVANFLLQNCDRRLCTEECFPQDSVGEVMKITADILQNDNDAGESPLGDLIVDSMRAATGTDFALLNGSAYNSGYSPIGLLFAATPGRPADAEGRVLESEIRNVLFGMLPAAAVNNAVGSYLATVSLTGQELYDLLSAPPAAANGFQVSGLTYTWDASLPTATRVTEIRKNGAAIDKAASYPVTVNTELSVIMSKAGRVFTTTDKDPEKELVKYLKSLPQPVAPPPADRVIKLN